VQTAVDAHVFAQIVAGAPPFGVTGTGLIAQLRNGITSMRAVGANPTIALLNPTDAAALDLSVTGTDNQYVFPLRDTGSSSPLWDLTVVERTSAAGTEPPYLIDPQMLGTLFLGAARFETDPYSGFANNTTRIRCELNVLYHIRQATGARRLAAT
jgi:Phage capsid family